MPFLLWEGVLSCWSLTGIGTLIFGYLVIVKELMNLYSKEEDIFGVNGPL